MELEINSHLIFDKSTKNMYWREDGALQQMVLREVNVHLENTNIMSLYLTLIKNEFKKYIQDLNVRLNKENLVYIQWSFI